MPGMMDTVLNLGLNDETAAGLAARADDARFAYDSYRRFIQMYADVVMGVDHGLFEDALETMKLNRGVFDDTGLESDDLALVDEFKSIVVDEAETDFPQDPWVQLWGAVGAVFTSWMNARAITYRRLNNIPASWGTAVNVQAMVFGNMGTDCATGVAFTRNPSTGENSFYGEFLINAQGEDVVAGIRTPLPLTRAARQVGDGGQWKRRCRTFSLSLMRCVISWKNISQTCRILNSPSSRTSSTCCRQEAANALLRQRCGCLSKWLRRG